LKLATRKNDKESEKMSMILRQSGTWE